MSATPQHSSRFEAHLRATGLDIANRLLHVLQHEHAIRRGYIRQLPASETHNERIMERGIQTQAHRKNAYNQHNKATHNQLE